jgi:hypothetical protein
VVTLAVLTLGSAAHLLEGLMLYDTTECDWGLWPLGASCESLGPSDPTRDPTGWFPTAAVFGAAVAITSLKWWSAHRPRSGTSA